METITVTVTDIVEAADSIRTFELRRTDGGALPPFEAGAHVTVDTPTGHRRDYSLANDPAETDRYVIGVLREPAGRGGSAAMHEQVKIGDRLTITPPLNHFPLAADAARHILIAGGIGITPILSMTRALIRNGAEWVLHYCCRDEARCAFRGLLSEGAHRDRVHFHFDGGDPHRGLDVAALLSRPAAGDHVYCCGPAGLMNAVKAATGHWPAGTVHFEYFVVDAPADTSGDRAFEVEIASTGAVLEVPADRSILDVLLDNGIFVPSSCTEGICGSCLVDVVEGDIDHRDLVLTDEEHAENSIMTVCCSRARSGRIVLDL